MENIIKLLSEIQKTNELLQWQEVQVKLSKDNIKATLIILLSAVNAILEKIKLCKNTQEAEKHFHLLEKVQSMISILISEEKVEISDVFWKLYKDFDRIDLAEERDFLFNEIKNNRYKLQ